jgi:hypothetical protein
MLDGWFGLNAPDEAANQWIRKAGAEHEVQRNDGAWEDLAGVGGRVLS